MLANSIMDRPLGVELLEPPPAEPLASLPEAMETARRLTAVLGDEIELLRGLDLSELRELAEEKARLTETWASQSAGLQTDRGFAETVEPRLRDEFLDVVEALQRTAQANAGALRAALDAHDRLFRAIASAAQEQRGSQAASGYAAGGQRPAPQPLATIGVAFDRSL